MPSIYPLYLTDQFCQTITMSDQLPFLFDIPTVSELTEKIKLLLEQNFIDVLVEGETSNVSQSRNGHFYFTLKDSGASLPCVVWRSTAQRLGLKLTDGQHIVTGGDIQLYAPHGRYQMIVNLVEQAGVGKLQQAYEKLKTRLQAEGLFDDEYKKPLPRYPETIGVITSATGAAFQDIRSTLEKRWPLATVKLYHASVQGVNATPEIVKGIQYFSSNKNVDVLIIGRGGGSLEDLWAFNEEAVARAVFDCEVPVISAVGHEVDFAISDFVADARAATPTHAAVLATPDINEIRYMLEDHLKKLDLNTRGSIEFYKDRVSSIAKSYALMAVKQKLETSQLTITSFQTKLDHTIQDIIRSYKENVTRSMHTLELMNPNIPLEKGFVRVWQNEKWIREVKAFNAENSFELEWKDEKVKISEQ